MSRSHLQRRAVVIALRAVRLGKSLSGKRGLVRSAHFVP